MLGQSPHRRIKDLLTLEGCQWENACHDAPKQGKSADGTNKEAQRTDFGDLVQVDKCVRNASSRENAKNPDRVERGSRDQADQSQAQEDRNIFQVIQVGPADWESFGITL